MRKPIIGVSTDLVTIDGHRFLATGEKYLPPLAAHGMRPRLLPSLGVESVDDLLDGLDGLLLTGAVSNIEPKQYGAGDDSLCPPFDPARDATTLPLVTACLARGIPLLAICRGLQEMNVALGGTLHPRVHEQAGRIDHRAAKGESHDVQYGPAHEVTLTPGGLLAGLADGARVITVNSLHWQGIDRLAPGLLVEAKANDGTIEAVRPEFAKNFALAVQWHPEWRFAENRLSDALFAAFGRAVMTVTASQRNNL